MTKHLPSILMICALACLPLSAQQGFYRELYADITGTAITDLTNNPKFPDSPDVEEIINGAMETGTNVGDYYGQRLRAILKPTVTGQYTFWIASDDNGELWLSTTASPVNRQRIARVTNWTNSREWTKETNQKSALITLTAGTRYYIEALQKENSGGDNLAIAWQVPGTIETNVIPAAVLTPYLDPPVIKTQPVSVDVEAQWAGVRSVTFTVATTRKSVFYQWQRDGVNIANANEQSYTLLADSVNKEKIFRCVITNLAGSVTTTGASYRFVPDNTPPTLLKWSVYHNPYILNLTFSEPLAMANATNPASYTVAGNTTLAATAFNNSFSVALRLASPLTLGTTHALSLAVQDCAVPANTLTLSNYSFTPPLPQTPPLDLIRGKREEPGPSSRRTPIAITEINHSPAPRNDNLDLRFVELYNSNPYPHDLSNYRFSGAFDYTFPSGTLIAAQSYLVVAPVPGDVKTHYNISGVMGGFEAWLFTDAASITLSDELGAWLSTISYDNKSPWPMAADRAGHTLVLARPSYGEREADGWSASALPGGSPGHADPPRPTAYESILINEVLAHSGEISGFVELHNVGNSAVSLAGCTLVHGKPGSTGYTLPAGTTISGYGFLTLDEAQLNFKINGAGDKIWLLAPPASTNFVIDAVRLDEQESNVAHGHFPDGDTQWKILQSPTPNAPNTPRRPAEVVINEIMYHPITDTKKHEYVELFNASTNAINLAGWKLKGDITYTFEELTLAPGGLVVVPRDATAFAELYPAAVNVAPGNYSGALSNSRGTLTLSKPALVWDTTDNENPTLTPKNSVVERLVYCDGGTWPQLADGGGSSLERIDPRADPALATSWGASDETQKSAWTTLEFTGKIDLGSSHTYGTPDKVIIGLLDAGECLIDSVELQAATGANLVKNPSFESGTDEWRFMGTHETSTIETTPDAWNGQRVLHLRTIGRVNEYPNAINGNLQSTLPKSGNGTIRLRARWLAGCPELLVRSRGNWIEACGNILTTRALGSPGQPNSHPHANTPPAITEVTHYPVLPRNGESVKVFARIADADFIANATLSYRIQGQPGTNTVTMTPCSAGFLCAELPAGLPMDTLLAFTIKASDTMADNGESRYPLTEERECLIRYNEPLVTRSFGVYRFWMTRENITRWATRERASNSPLPATFVYGGSRVAYDAGMMYSGSPFHNKGYQAPLSSATIDYEGIFAKDNLVLDDDGFVLATTGNLGNDGIAIREQFCYRLGQALNLPTVYRRFVHLYANGVEMASRKIYEDTEKPGGSYLKHWFPERDDDLNDFFRVDDWFEYDAQAIEFANVNARLERYLTDAPGGGQMLKQSRYRWNWNKRSHPNFAGNDYTHLLNLVETLNAPTSDYLAGVQNSLNLMQFLPVIAVNQFIGNYDSYGYNRGKNMYLYHGAQKWQLLLWDLDFNFGLSRPLDEVINPTSPSFNTDDPTMRRLLTTPAVTRIFWRAVAKLIESSGSPAIRSEMRMRYDALRADATNLDSSYESFFSSVDTRRNHVLSQLNSANAAAFTVTTPAATLTTSSGNIVTVSGAAPFAVTTLRVNGSDVALTWTTPTTWQTEVVLNSGTNHFKFTALDENNAVAGTVTRAIVYTGIALDPLAGFLRLSEVMPNPATPGTGYIEIANRSKSTIMNLSQVYLDGSVKFNFPAGTTLGPESCLLVVANRTSFAEAWPNVTTPLAGVYSGTLPVANGTVRLMLLATGFETDDHLLDSLSYDSSLPDCALQRVNLDVPSARPDNWATTTNGVSTIVTNTIVPWSQSWKYYITGYPGNNWESDTFNDTSWATGPGPLGYETAVLPIPIATTHALTPGRITYYYRTTFNYSDNLANAALLLSYVIDDAAVWYLNGTEIHRSSLMPDGIITDTTVTVNGRAKTPEGELEGPFILSSNSLRRGINTLAVRVHQNQPNSSDLVFATKLEIVTTTAAKATPGAPNHSDYSLNNLPDIWLNELQSCNTQGAVDNHGDYEPWCELFNAGTNSASLTGWSLSTTAELTGWSFPTGTQIAPGEFLRVWLDGQPEQTAPGHLHTDFRFAFVTGTLFLSAEIEGVRIVADSLTIKNSPDNASWGAWPDGAATRYWLNPATPGTSNRIDRPTQRVVINEFMAQNDLFFNPLSGQKDDWLELFNDGLETVDLTDWVVTDTLTSESPPTPDLRASKALIIPAGITLAPGASLRIWTGAKDSNKLPFDPDNLQAPFGLSKTADQICLFTPDLQLVDRLQYNTEQVGYASTGRWPNGAMGALVTLPQPTPGKPNRNPRFTTSLLAQPEPYTLPEEVEFVATNSATLDQQTLPANLTWRLYATEGMKLPTNIHFNTQNAVLTWTPDEAQGPGIYPLRLCAFIEDGLDTIACDELLLTLSVIETTRPPIIHLQPAVNYFAVDEGSLITFTITTERQPEIPPRPVATALLSLDGATLPATALFNPLTGTFTWQTDEPDGPTNLVLAISATDPDEPAIRATTNITLVVNEVNRPFTYASPTTFYLWRNEPFAVHLRYNDPDLPPNVFSYSLLSGAPAGLTLDSATGLLQWQPTMAQTGRFTMRVRAFDGAGAALTTEITLNVDTAYLSAAELKAKSGQLALRWQSKRDALYTVEWCDNLNTPVWLPVSTTVINGTGATITYIITPVEIGAPANAFFRIRQTHE